MIGNIPSWIWPAMAGGGVGAWILFGTLSTIPGVNSYAGMIKPISIAVTVFGIFMYGGSGTASIYQAQIQAMEKRVAVADQHSIDTSNLVEEKTQQQIKVIRQTQIVYRDRIKEVEKVIDVECKVDKAALDLLNNAAANPLKAQK